MVDLPTFARMYVDLYDATNEALKHLAEGDTEAAIHALAEGQVKTIGQLLES